MGAQLFILIKVLGALCVFIYGMKLMSESVQRAAGGSFRKVLRSVTRNRFRGLLTGFVTTAAIQSSSATTVMTVSLVNAGIISLTQSVGVMLGANVGTTITAWIVSLLGFRFEISQLILPLFLFGMILVMSGRGKRKYYGEFVFGIAILFLGLDFLQSSVPDLGADSPLISWVRSLADSGLGTRVIFVLLGAVITILIQSSTAAIVLTMTMCIKGWIPFELGACLVLGENIGTTITAEVASLIGNVYARRAARIHSLFNLVGVTWMVIFLPFFTPLVAYLQEFLFGGVSVLQDSSTSDVGLAIFHSGFNILNATIAMLVAPYLVKAAEMTVTSRADDDELSRLRYFDEVVRTPELALLEVKRELVKFCNIIIRKHGFSKELWNSTRKKERSALVSRLEKYNDISDSIYNEITDYITSLSQEELSFATSVSLRSMLNVCNDLRHIAEGYQSVTEEVQYKAANKIWVNPTQRNALNTYIDYTRKTLEALQDSLEHEEDRMSKLDLVKEAVEAAKIYHRHIKNPVALQRAIGEDEDVEQVINERGAKAFDNILYQYERINIFASAIADGLEQ